MSNEVVSTDWSGCACRRVNIEITSVFKKEQKLSQAIRRHLRHHAGRYPAIRHDLDGGADAMVPGMDVGQIQGGAWAVSARGFNDEYNTSYW